MNRLEIKINIEYNMNLELEGSEKYPILVKKL